MSRNFRLATYTLTTFVLFSFFTSREISRLAQEHISTFGPSTGSWLWKRTLHYRTPTTYNAVPCPRCVRQRATDNVQQTTCNRQRATTLKLSQTISFFFYLRYLWDLRIVPLQLSLVRYDEALLMRLATRFFSTIQEQWRTPNDPLTPWSEGWPFSNFSSLYQYILKRKGD